MALQNLTKFIVPPSKISNIISWKKHGSSVILSLDISDERIGMAIAKQQHQQQQQQQQQVVHSTNTAIHALDPIPFLKTKRTSTRRRNSSMNRREGSERAAHFVAERIEEFGACALLVGWPLLPDGRPGALCGKVLHFLDHLVAAQSNPLLSHGRPLTLWDMRKIPGDTTSSPTSSTTTTNPTQQIDAWGRSTMFTRIPPDFPAVRDYRSFDEFRHPRFRRFGQSDDSTDSALMLQQFLNYHQHQHQHQQQHQHNHHGSNIYDSNNEDNIKNNNNNMREEIILARAKATNASVMTAAAMENSSSAYEDNDHNAYIQSTLL